MCRLIAWRSTYYSTVHNHHYRDQEVFYSDVVDCSCLYYCPYCFCCNRHVDNDCRSCTNCNHHLNYTRGSSCSLLGLSGILLSGCCCSPGCDLERKQTFDLMIYMQRAQQIRYSFAREKKCLNQLRFRRKLIYLQIGLPVVEVRAERNWTSRPV